MADAIRGQMSVNEDVIALLKVNQPQGFDCPGCAGPDPLHTSSFEFCENGAKAVSWEATGKRATPDFFAAHTVSKLWQRHYFDLEGEERLTQPMKYDAETDTYRPIEWGVAFREIGAQLRRYTDPDCVEFYTSGARPTRRHSSTSCLPANTTPIISPTVPICAMNTPVWVCRHPSALVKHRDP